MNNLDITSTKILEAEFEGRLGQLANSWGVPLQKNQENDDPEIIDIRNSAKFGFLGRTNLSLVRLAKHSPFEEHRLFFEGLRAQNYQPRMYGLNLKEGTEHYEQAKTFLKTFARLVGDKVIQDHEISANGVEVIETDMSPDDPDWAAPTIPAALQKQDEKLTLAEEKSIITETIKNLSPLQIASYLKERMEPRLEEVDAELAQRRATKYDNDTSFALKEGPLLDFRTALVSLIAQAKVKVALPEANRKADDAPYPVLIEEVTEEQAARINAASPPKMNEAQLEKAFINFQTKLNAHIATLSGTKLKEFAEKHLAPKHAELLETVFALADKGNDPDQLRLKEKHLAAIDAGIATVEEKMKAEAAKLDTDLTTLRQRLYGHIDKLSGEQLVSFHEKQLKPKADALTNDIQALTQAGNDPTLLNTKQRHLAVIQAGMSATVTKIDAERAVAVPAVIAPIANDPVAAPSYPSAKAIAAAKTTAKTVDFKEGGAETKPPKSLWAKAKEAAAWTAGIAVGAFVALYAGAVVGTLIQDYKYDQAKAKQAASAQADFSRAAQGAITPAPLEPQAATIIVQAPANDVSVPAAAAPVEPTQPVVHHKASKPVVHKAKADFATTAANDVEPKSKPIVAREFDIATSAMDLATWNRACDALQKHNMTVEGGVCPIKANFP